MPLVHTTLILATLLCSLVAGFLFAFAVVVMPGIGRLDDRHFVLSFREIDGVIQRGQPLFGLVWLGSILLLALGIVLGVGQLAGEDRLLLVAAGGAYFVGVQLPTFAVNIRLNNALQALEVAGMDEGAWRSARERFESRWNRWNLVRSVFAVLTTAILSVLLLRL